LETEATYETNNTKRTHNINIVKMQQRAELGIEAIAGEKPLHGSLELRRKTLK